MGLKKIGGAWLRQGKTSKFISGQIMIDGVKHSFLMFKNTNKTQEESDAKLPDYEILVSDGNDQRGGQ